MQIRHVINEDETSIQRGTKVYEMCVEFNKNDYVSCETL